MSAKLKPISEIIKRFFDPCLTVVYTNGRWRSDRIESYKLMQQFRLEAGLANHAWPDPPDAYDRILAAAGNHGWSLEYHGDREHPEIDSRGVLLEVRL